MWLRKKRPFWKIWWVLSIRKERFSLYKDECTYTNALENNYIEFFYKERNSLLTKVMPTGLEKGNRNLISSFQEGGKGIALVCSKWAKSYCYTEREKNWWYGGHWRTSCQATSLNCIPKRKHWRAKPQWFMVSHTWNLKGYLKISCMKQCSPQRELKVNGEMAFPLHSVMHVRALCVCVCARVCV